MTKFADLTIDQIRNGLHFIRRNAKAAIEAGDPSLARCLNDKAEQLFSALVMRIQNDDPWTTEADIRHFEGINI